MSDTTQETVVEAPVTDKVEAAETQGVEQEVVTADPQTPEAGQSEEEQEQIAQESLFKTLMSQKGWKSEEDFAKSYAELEKSFSKKAQDYATLEKLTEAILADEPNDAYISDTDKEVKELKADRDIRLVAEKFNDFGDYAEKMQEIAKNTPNANVLFAGAKGVETLYKMAKVDSMDSVVEKAREEGKKEVLTKELEKGLGEVASGTKAKTPGKKVFTRQEIANMSLEEYNANEAEIKSQMNAGLIQ